MRLRLMTVLAGLAMVSLVAAQPSSSVILRSGEEFAGQLVDLNAQGFAFNVNGQERMVQRSEIVSIDFGGANVSVPDQLDSLGSGQSLALLRSGEVVVGEFYDIGGRMPLRITFRIGSGERELSSNDVRRIYVTKPVGGQASAAGDSGNARTVTVQATQQWTATNIAVRRGQVVRFETTGEIALERNGASVTPAGISGRLDPNAPLPTTPTGALVGRVGSIGRPGSGLGAPFLIGSHTSVVMPADGPLFLGVNDSIVSDNNRSFQVRITLQ